MQVLNERTDVRPSDGSPPMITAASPAESPSRWRVLAEIFLIFAVFAIQGAWPVPDTNESYYIDRAIHYWHPDWLQGDFFMESTDTHKVFYFAVGWLSLLMSPVTMAWTGRILTWSLLAWSWRRLSAAIVPRPWYSVLTAALFACLMERFHMAGEWVIGGLEAKGFAYVFVFLGIESVVRNRWNRGLVLFGIASAFHVLVGGWSAIAAGLAWLWLHLPSPASGCHHKVAGAGAEGVILPSPASGGHHEVVGAGGEGVFPTSPSIPTAWPKARSPLPSLRSLLPGILIGFLLALPGLIPSLLLDWDVASRTARESHEIYVFERLPHHLMLTGMRVDFIERLVLVWCVWVLLGYWGRRTSPPMDRAVELRRLRAIVAGAVLIALAGAAICLLVPFDRMLAADLLRYYWFRTTDVLLPLGFALEGVALIVWALAHRPRRGRLALTLAILVAACHVAGYVPERLSPRPPRSNKMANYADWRTICEWAADPQNIPPGARFLTPRSAHTFRWYAGHSEVVCWKDVPQNGGDIVAWWQRMQNVHATELPPPNPRWHVSLVELGAERLKELGAEYDADYVITDAFNPPLDLEAVYRNRSYVVYRLR